jgi:AraC-like DNA-binding protein
VFSERPVKVALVARAARVEMQVRSWLPSRWIVAVEAAEPNRVEQLPDGVLVSDSQEILQNVTRRGRVGGGGILVSSGGIELHGSQWGHPSLPAFSRTARSLRVAVLTSELRAREAHMLERLDSTRRSWGGVVIQFARQLLLEPIPDQAQVIQRRRAEEEVYLRPLAVYAREQGCSQRHLQLECRRIGFTPTHLKDSVLLKAVLQVRLSVSTVGAVARRVGFAHGSSVSRFVGRVAGVPYRQLPEEAVLEALGRVEEMLGLFAQPDPANDQGRLSGVN